ncbi:methionine/alanine import family NSS transporter small subunit [Microbacterium xanthum]|uniref:methionine/alanine import family NSS transporter small subunit n=1 Tax=Microbacterium xanthum TaxID=3079794 RepID=UPI002AD3DF47|nr:MULTISPECIES: methionine/alanine import family NSS transporter small subunit [unclassified Microbacterium]MDZ8172554.1 methionine/alanine import family NSS transporter small subunit [Microbacterium sp. KSW-48]MDZ8202609.1 methionine/alanine import family NSS transporter small subunit [Microbacterium sp. SSW1-59]
MTPIAVTFLVLAIIVVWGGLIASSLFLRSRPETSAYPPGGVDDHREDVGVIEHDT